MRWLKRLLHLSNCDWCGRVRRCEECRMGSYSRQRCRECRGVLGGLCTGRQGIPQKPIEIPKLGYLTYSQSPRWGMRRFNFTMNGCRIRDFQDVLYPLTVRAISGREETVAKVLLSAAPSHTPSVDAMVAQIPGGAVVTREGVQFGEHSCYSNFHLPMGCIVVCHPSAVTLFHQDNPTFEEVTDQNGYHYILTDEYTVVLTNRNLALVWGAESAAVETPALDGISSKVNT